MAKVVHCATGRSQILEHYHSVGRASKSSLQISETERYVSLHHALIFWTGSQWEVKDLASRNGTFLDGQRLAPGQAAQLWAGAKIAFGKPEQEWEVTEVSAPTTMVVPLEGGEPIPSPQEPSVTIFRSADGAWQIEQSISVTPITDQQTFIADARAFKFCCVDSNWKTSLATSSTLEVRHLSLVFSVSQDEEHVHIHGTCGGQTLDLGDRGHNYLLLTLARRRLADVREGLPESACGWISQDDMAHDPMMAPPQLNIDVFRIRKQFAAAGVGDAANVIERRPRTKQIRIGVPRLSIVAV